MQINIGKNSLNEGIIIALENAFKTRENVKVSVLKSGGHDKEKIKQMAEETVFKLGKKYTYKIVGFVINIHKWRKARK